MTSVGPASAVSADIDAGDPAVGPPTDVVAVAVVDGAEHSAEGNRSAIFDAAQTVRGFGRAFSELPAGFSDKVADDRRWHWRPEPAVWSALQHAAHFADLLAGIAADLSYLLDSEGRVRFVLPADPDSVSNELDPDVVLAVLAADAERVARRLESAPANPGEGAAFPIAVGGVIITLAQKAVREGASALGSAHDALTRAAAAPPPPNTDGAATAAAGLDAARTAVPDVVLTDFDLPDADDGRATVAGLRVADAVIVAGSGNGPQPGGRDDEIGAWTAMTETSVDDGDGAPAVQKSKLADSLADMAGLLFDEVALESLLQLVVSLARSTLDAADEASVSVVHAGVFETITATSPAVRDLDHVQYESGRGPCVAATRGGERITTGFDDETGRWPEFARAGLARGFAGVLAIPLTVGTRRLGAINLYSLNHSTFAAADADAAQVFADHAAVALANAVSFANARVLNESLAEALKTRDVIAMAKALLMNRDGLSAAEASTFLRRTSRQRNTTVRELSQETIDRAHSSGYGDVQR